MRDFFRFFEIWRGRKASGPDTPIFILSLSLSLSLSLARARALSLSDTHTHKALSVLVSRQFDSLSRSLSLTHTHSLTHTRTRTLECVGLALIWAGSLERDLEHAQVWGEAVINDGLISQLINY